MMKKIIVLTAGFFLSAQCALAEPTPTATTPPSNEDAAVYISDQLKFMPHSLQEENAKQHYVIKASYPQVEGDSLSDNAKKFNAVLLNATKYEMAQFKKYVIEDTIHMQTLPESVRHNTLTIDYDTNVVKPENRIILSVRMNIEGMQAGRAHPYHRTRVFNFDLTNGKELQLSDLFKPHSKFLSVISTYCKTALEKKLDDKFMIADGTKPIDKNFKNWNIEDDSLVISFDEYQVAPYVYGKQEVEIPFTALKNIIGERSIIAPCLKDSTSCMPE